MRIRFTIDIERRKTPPDKPEPPHHDEQPYLYDLDSSQTELAEPPPVGFQIQPTDDR